MLWKLYEVMLGSLRLRGRHQARGSETVVRCSSLSKQELYVRAHPRYNDADLYLT